MALDLSALSAEQQMAAIYIGYYDRAADPFGENFWIGAVNNPNLSLADIATDFSTQAETQAVHPFFTNPTAEEANAFITSLYLNLFNREPDAEGLAFWSAQLIAAVNGEPNSLAVGEIILAIIEGAQDVEGGTQDRTTILNKIEVATAWTDAAADAGLTEADSYANDAGAQASAKSIIESVSDDAASVTTALSEIDDFFAEGPVPGDTFILTSDTDVLTGTADDDEFLGYIQQNPFLGNASNTLSSAERLDGGAGNDRLYAELSPEFVGFGGIDNDPIDALDVQPRLKNIEEIDIEAREFGGDLGGESGPKPPIFQEPPLIRPTNPLDIEPFALSVEDTQVINDIESRFYNGFEPIVFDAKHVTDHEEIGSYFSDGDLKIENLTTLTSGGSARNTDAITVTMDHTDNFNSDGDASDLVVLFDNDYLLSGQESTGQVFYFLLDEDAELAGLDARLNNIDVDGLRFNITNSDGSVTEVTLQSDAANVAGTHQGFVNALQAPLQALIADGTLPAGTTLTLDPTIVDDTFLDDGSRSDDIPAIVLTTGDGSEVIATGFSRVEEPIGEYDVYGRFNSENEVEDQPITVNIDLHKVGRGGEGGDLVVGGKAQSTPDGVADGIEVFKINVLGAGNDDPNGNMTKPSSLGTVTSTGDELREVYIATDPMYANGDTFASLEIRDGFNELGRSGESGDLQLVNADAFRGDLTLGTGGLSGLFSGSRIINLDTLTAQGGGDVEFYATLNGQEEQQAYSYTTGAGDDTVNVLASGDALDFDGSSLNISTNDGNDEVVLSSPFFTLLELGGGEDGPTGQNLGNQDFNQAILDNITIETGAGEDVIKTAIISRADVNIDAGAGADFIDTSGGGAFAMDTPTPLGASWAFNYDDARADGSDLNALGTPRELPGVPESLAYVGGAKVTVTLSGAGAGPDGVFAGGGVMSQGGADPFTNGYEASATVTVAGPNDYFGTQVDVNNAIIEAITSDPILSKLITLELTENNTWVMHMNTRGFFEQSGGTGDTMPDIRIDIDQRDGDADYWDDVEAEARSVFSDSSLSISDLGDANGDDDGPDVPDLRDTAGTNHWYTGLSAYGDEDNAAIDDTQIVPGVPAILEQDNVINGGSNDAADDLIVMNTDNIPVLPEIYTPIPGNTLINGASNETIVMEGNFGDDTIMNFTTADIETTIEYTAETATYTIGGVTVSPQGDADVSVAVISGVLSSGEDLEVTLENGTSGSDILDDIAEAINSAPGALFSASVSTSTITLVGLDANVDAGAVSFYVEDRDVDAGDAVIATFTSGELGSSITTSSTDAEITLDLAPGLDFLDFTSYLTSEEDVSDNEGASDTSDSHNPIPVTLDYGTDDELDDEVDANEVAVVRLGSGDESDETFAALTAADIENLFNNDSDDGDYGDLDDSDFTVADNYSDDALVNAAKAIVMVENGGNLGEYKVFELTWDGNADGPSVSAVEIGSLDFGTSLEGLTEVNLVGSAEYADLIRDGFGIPTPSLLDFVSP